MEKGNRISYILSEMNEVNEKLNKYKKLYMDIKTAGKCRFLNIQGNAHLNTFNGAYKVKHINLELEDNLKERVLEIMENYCCEKGQELKEQLEELQETLKSL